MRLFFTILILFMPLLDVYAQTLDSKQHNISLDYLYLTGEMAVLEGRQKLALSLFNQINTYEEGAEIQLRLAQEYWNQGLRRQAEMVCKKIIQKFQGDIAISARMLIAEIYSSVELFSKALEQYEKILSIHSDYRPALFYQALSLKRMFQSIPEKTLKLFKDDSQFHFALGNIYLEQQKKEQAVRAFKTAFRLDLSHRLAVWKLFQIYSQINKPHLFIQFIEEQESTRFDSYIDTLLARAYLRQGHLQKTQDYMADLLWNDPAVLDLKAEWTMGLLTFNQ